jgi:hypothetical protein
MMMQTAFLDQNMSASLNDSMRKHRIWFPYWILSSLTLGLAMIMDGLYPNVDIDYLSFANSIMFEFFLQIVFLFIAYQLGRALLLQRPGRPTKFIIYWFISGIKVPSTWLMPLINFAALVIWTSCFGGVKPLISVAHPFNWDARLSKIDQLLHFGFDPWKLTHIIFPSDIATYCINFAYQAWFFIIFGFIFWAILVNRHKSLRVQFLFASMGLWIFAGLGVATVFSSAGPCYYHHLVAGDAAHYQPLMHKLQATHQALTASGWSFGLPSLNVQTMLWNNHITNGGMFGGGISAFPSMHVATSVTMALLARRLNLWFGRLMVLFAITIMIGSVHLGWHYAVDGYASTLLAIAAWKLSGWLVRTCDAGGAMA